MKKTLLIIAVSLLLFSFVFAEDDSEVIGADHNQPIIQELVKGVESFSQQIFDRVYSVAEIITNEVERRQKIIEKQIEERKNNLFTTLKNEIKEVVNSLIESTFNEIEESIDPNSSEAEGID